MCPFKSKLRSYFVVVFVYFGVNLFQTVANLRALALKCLEYFKGYYEKGITIPLQLRNDFPLVKSSLSYKSILS